MSARTRLLGFVTLTLTALAPVALAQPAGDPNPQDVIKEMERKAGEKPATNPNSPATPTPTPFPSTPAAGGAVTPAGAPVPTATSVGAGGSRLLREGTFIASRRGRMTRSSDGQWTMVFDADRSGKAEPPMTLMPCLNLQAMEKLAERGGESLSFTVSGQVFVYKGRNHLLPTLYVVNRRAEVSTAG